MYIHLLFIYFGIYISKTHFMLFVYLFINYVILTLRH